MHNCKTQVIVTLGPATLDETSLRRFKAKGVDFVRVNMSHSSIEDLENAIALAKKVGIPFVIDTEGSQVRTGRLEKSVIRYPENAQVRVTGEPVLGNESQLCLRPSSIIEQLEPGDLIHVDFDTLVLRVTSVATARLGYISTRVVTEGFVGNNKAVVIVPVLARKFEIPPLSAKDERSLEVGVREGIGHVAVSFVRSAETVQLVRKRTNGSMAVISKVECLDALERIDEIIEASDYLLIDRGDMSKEIPIERIPFTQKIIIAKANRANVGVFVATNLLETMIDSPRPTRAEVQDVINTLADGASGLVLAAETAIGKHPVACVNMLDRLIRHAETMLDGAAAHDSSLIEQLERFPIATVHPATRGDLHDATLSSALVPPHGGHLVNRVASHPRRDLDSLPHVPLDPNSRMDLDQIAIGTYSPLEGFMTEEQLRSVLDEMQLPDGTVWPVPILFGTSAEIAEPLHVGDDVALVDAFDQVVAVLHLADKYRFDADELCQKMYGTSDDTHPGVRVVRRVGRVFLGGTVELFARRQSEVSQYDLSPRQVRRMFEERGWATVLGFHTRNVIHRAHEFIQMRALEEENCDGLFVHPVVGRRKPGDYHPRLVVRSYERMIHHFYPSRRVVLATFSTFSRYAGPREALFTALCRKNFGCSHFIVGRDHTGVGDFYPPEASQRIFDRFPDLGITPVRFDEVYFSQRANAYVVRTPDEEMADELSISGTEARSMFLQGETPPGWFMRPEISQLIVNAIENGEEVFVGGN
jgi:pyruvate kinase